MPKIRDAIYHSGYTDHGIGIDNPAFDPTHRGRPPQRTSDGFDPYTTPTSDSSFPPSPPPPPPPLFPEREAVERPDDGEAPVLRLNPDAKQNPLFLETAEFSTNPDEGERLPAFPSRYPEAPNTPSPPPALPLPVDHPLQYPLSHPLQLRPSNLPRAPSVSEKPPYPDVPLKVAPSKSSLKYPPSVSIIGADDRFHDAHSLQDRFEDFDRRSSYNFSTPSVSLPSLGLNI